MMSTASSQSATTTTDDPSDSGMHSFTTFQPSELETSWDYYERSVTQQSNDLSSSVNNSYTRPWEMETKEQQQQHQQQLQQQQQQQQRGFEPFPKLPSFQSQFHAFADNNLVPSDPSLPTQVTAVPVPISPSSASPSGGSLTQLTQLTASPCITPLQSSLSLPPSNFHTIATINTRPYPVVPAPIPASEIPSIQRTYLDERHIQIYQPITTTTTFHHPAPPQQGVVTILKNDTVNYDLKNGLHHTNFPNPLMDTSSYMDNGLNSGISQITTATTKLSNKNGVNGIQTPPPSANIQNKGETRKKERRKIRASSLESSTESDASSAMDIDGGNSGNPGQVAAVSSTANFKSPMHTMETGDESMTPVTGEKQVRTLKAQSFNR
jgi:hypothetical protein